MKKKKVETSVKDFNLKIKAVQSMKIHQISGPRAVTAVAGPPAGAVPSDS